MKDKIQISVIIPTWNRHKTLLSVLESLKKQTINQNLFEIIICDSSSTDDTQKMISNFKNQNPELKVVYTNIEKNILASKRNHGIKNSQGNIVVLLDDDCVPDVSFLQTYLNELDNSTYKTVLCGIVDYPEDWTKKSNYLKYRKSRHFNLEVEKDMYNCKLKANKIVAMNMAFRKSQPIHNTGYFNEKFLGYGFEDYDFGWRLIELGFDIKPSFAKVIHMETGENFEGYLKKIYHLGRDGMNNLIQINHKAARNSIYYRIESNFLVNFFSKNSFFIKLLKLSEKIIIYFEKMPYFYTPFIYRVALASAYIRGFVDRKNAATSINVINKSWYS